MMEEENEKIVKFVNLQKDREQERLKQHAEMEERKEALYKMVSFNHVSIIILN
jgi:hypothetical protein